jgi:hypothetical protein
MACAKIPGLENQRRVHGAEIPRNSKFSSMTTSTSDWAGAAGAQRLLESIVFEVCAGDPIFLLSASAVIAIAATAAAYLPADPTQALRSE